MVKRPVPRGQTALLRSSSPLAFWFGDYYCFAATLCNKQGKTLILVEGSYFLPLRHIPPPFIGARKARVPALLRAALVNSIATDDRRSPGDVEPSL